MQIIQRDVTQFRGTSNVILVDIFVKDKYNFSIRIKSTNIDNQVDFFFKTYS